MMFRPTCRHETHDGGPIASFSSAMYRTEGNKQQGPGKRASRDA